jgi:hypothetical protein
LRLGLAAVAAAVVVGGASAATDQNFGYDISYPQCPSS